MDKLDTKPKETSRQMLNPTWSENLSNFSDNEIDLLVVWRLLWKKKALIAFFSTVFALASIVYSLSLPNIYRSSVLVAANQYEMNSQIGSKFSGLAGLAGINLLSGNSDKVTIALAVLTSREFLLSFIKRRKISPELLAVDAWDPLENKVRYIDGIYDSGNRKWAEVDGESVEPTNEELYENFMGRFNVEESKETGLIVLQLNHLSPFVAKQWLDWIVSDLNEVIRQRDIEEATASIAYLNGQIAGTSLADMRSVFYDLIVEQTQKVMMASVRDEYIFKVVDPAFVPERKYSPRRFVICVVGTLVGTFLGVLWVIIAHSFCAARPQKKTVF